MGTFLVVVVIVALIWFCIRWLLKAPKPNQSSTRTVAQYNQAGNRRIQPTLDFTIPNIGREGTATEAQQEAAERALGIPLHPLSAEQASIILDARDYARGMLAVFYREGVYLNEDGSVAAMIAFILSDEPTRRYIDKWGTDRFRRGTHNEDPRLRRNEHFQRIYAFVAAQL